ncbi:uncharacterized protein JCM15063_003607 [Sporobolomyces koalae]|uniref:uncharacterized protein n=1 Tax=Sporobolomyces koalae TaxID=500713 RepID=UPI00317A0BD1
MQGEASHGHLAGFSPRQSSYLRISPTLVLQLILYLEPHHVEWMNVGVFERILVALKDRIPIKIQQEDITNRYHKSGSGPKHKDKVDVFRGTDYQMAFFFRKTNDKHVVLLKEKHLHYVTSDPATHSRRAQTRDPAATSRGQNQFENPYSPPPSLPELHPSKPVSESHVPRARSEDDEEDALGMMGPPRRTKRQKRLPRGSDDSSIPLTQQEEEQGEQGEETLDPLITKRLGEESLGDAADEDDTLLRQVKPEPIDEDPLAILSEATSRTDDQDGRPLFRREEEQSQTPFAPLEEEEAEPTDVKPQLRVTYQKFEIFNRSLVVIVEPYPALPLNRASQTPRPNFMNTEIRQLSASVQPGGSGRYSTTPFDRTGDQDYVGGDDPNRSTSSVAFSRAGTLSMTPVPQMRRGGGGRGGSLFRRSETTPLEDSRSTVGADDEDSDQRLRELREMSEIFRDGGHLLATAASGNKGDESRDEDIDSDEDLPTVDELLQRKK